MLSFPQDHSLDQQLSRAFHLFEVLFVAGLAATSLLCVLRWTWITPELNRSRLAAKAESAAYAAIVDEENDLHARHLPGEPSLWDRGAHAESVLVTANRELVASAGSVPDFAAAMMDTRVAEEKWHERWAHTIAETPSDGAASSLNEEKALFDAYISEHAAFAAAIDGHIEAVTGREARMTQLLVILELVGFTVAFFLARHQHRALRILIVAPLAALMRDIGRVRDGELEAIVEHTGPRELRDFGQALNRMVRTLAGARGVAESRGELLRDHSTRLRQILDASREFSESLNLVYVVGAVRASTAAVGGYERVIVWLMAEEQTRLVDSEGKGQAAAAPPAEIEMGQGLAGRAAKSGRITVEGPDGHVRFSDTNNRSVSAMAVPLIVGARVIGVLEARNAQPRLATSQAVEVLEMFATHAATAIEAARLHELTEERSQMDPLTQLFNRRRLEQDFDIECKRCARYSRPLAFVMLDIDHFKAFNDNYGHPQGDVALKEAAQVIASAVRTTDTAYRYGGEEFCILLRETGGADAMVFAERLRRRIEQRFASGTLMSLTASLGVAEFSADLPTAREIVEAADVAMYESKHAGRNRVMLSSLPPPLSPATTHELESHPAN